MKYWHPMFLLGLIILGAFCLWFLQSKDNNAKLIASIQKRVDSEKMISVVAFGDSLTAGYGLPEGDSYPAQLQKVLIERGYQVKVMNLGVSGETTAENLKRVEEVKVLQADIVILGIGGNDALRQLSVVEAKKNILATVTSLQSSSRPPVVILLKMQAPPTAGFGYKKDFDNLYEEVAKEKKIILLPLITTELFLDPKNKLSDGLHYNALGYKKVVEQYLLPTMIEIMDKLKGN